MANNINGFEIDEYNVFGIPTKAANAKCPYCSETRKKKNDKCMSVFWDTGLGQCNHCSEKNIQLHTYKKKTDNQVKVYKKPAVKPKKELSNLVLDWFKNERSISKKTLEKLRISESNRWMPKMSKGLQTTHAIEFNYYLFGELINVKYRAKGKDFMFAKDAELILYNIDSIIGQESAIIVEGEPDTCAYVECGQDSVASVPNGFTMPRGDGSSTINLSFLDEYYGILEPIKRFYIAVDNDPAGREGRKELVRRLGAEKCYLVDFKDCKDANEYLKKYGKEALYKTIEDATQVPLEGIITIADVNDELDDFWLNGAQRGMTIDLEGFDEAASFETRQYTLVTAAPGAGKSDFVDEILCKIAIKYGHKVGICSTENQPYKFHYDKIFRKIHGLRPKDERQIKTEIVVKTKEFIQGHFFHVKPNGRYYLKEVLAKFAELVTRKGCRWFVLDPFNKISIKGMSKVDMLAYTAEYHQLLDEFCIKYDAHLFLVAHPVKMELKEGSSKTFKMPTGYNIKGGGEHFDMSYNIIGIVRDYEREMVHIRTLKWKFQHLGVSGVDSWFGWNINNGRYTAPEGGYDADKETTQGIISWRNGSWLFPMAKEYEAPEEEKPKELPKYTPAEAFAEPVVMVADDEEWFNKPMDNNGTLPH